MSIRFIAAAVIVLCLPGVLLAQQNPNLRRQQQQQFGRQMMPPGGKSAKIEGTVESVTPSGLIVSASIDGMNQRLQIPISAATKVEVTGNISAKSLQTGEVIQFEADIENSQIKAKVAELTLLGQSSEVEEGVFPSGAGGDKGDKADKPADQPAAGGKAKKHPKTVAKGLTNGPHLIVGRVVTPRGAAGKYFVTAGRKKLAFSLDQQAVVAVKSSDYTLAASGDKVTAEVSIAPGRGPQNMMIQASTVKIELKKRIE